MRGKHEPAGVVEQGVVDAPGVDADGGESGNWAAALRRPVLHLGPEAGQVPVVVRPERLEGVGKAVDLGERETLVDQVPTMTRPLVAPRSMAAQ